MIHGHFGLTNSFFFCHQIHSDRLPVVPVSDSFIRKIHKNGISIDWKRWASKHAYHGSIQISNLILSRWISLLVNNLFFFLSLLCRYFSKMSVIRSMEKKKLDKHVCKWNMETKMFYFVQYKSSSSYNRLLITLINVYLFFTLFRDY